MEEKLEKRCGLMEEKTRKLRDAWKKMEGERELLLIKVMEQAGKERERLRKEAEKVEEIKELRDKLKTVRAPSWTS